MSKVLDDIFGGEAVPFHHVYEAAQIVVKDYMVTNNVKIDAVSEQLGTTAGYLRGILDPKQTLKPLSVDKAIEISLLTGDRRILDAIGSAVDNHNNCSRHGVDHLVKKTLALQADTGDLSAEVLESVKDNVIDAKERKRIRKKAIQQMKTAQEILAFTEEDDAEE